MQESCTNRTPETEPEIEPKLPTASTEDTTSEKK
jgi:hypothetical protein